MDDDSTCETQRGNGLATGGMTREQLDLLKNTVCKGPATTSFPSLCRSSSEHSLTRSRVKYISLNVGISAQRKEVMTPQISIDGARLIAER
jgi:hypothetical protein